MYTTIHNMVLLTVDTRSNPHTLYFDYPIEKPSSIRLLSASLCNSWHTLKKGTVIYADFKFKREKAKFLPGHYNADSLANDLNALSADKPQFIIKVKTYTPLGIMIIFDNDTNMLFDSSLLQLLGIPKLPKLGGNLYIKRLQIPSTYFVHCDLIDKKQNLLNGKPSTVLARFDVKGKPFEKVHYQTTQPHVLRKTDSGDYDVNSITLSVQDKDGNLFDFNGMPLEFEVEIN